MSEFQNEVKIRVKRFFEQADPKKDDKGRDTGELVMRDYVEYGPPGLLDRQAVIARVERILKARAPQMGSKNVHEQAAWDRAQVIKPLYDAWKKGEEVPQTGTPIAACNFLRSEEVAILKAAGIRTAEELAELSDRDCEVVRLPSMMAKRTQAQRFLDAQDTNKAAAQMAARDALLAEQADELAELKRMVADLTAASDTPEIDGNGDRIPKRRGRQPDVPRETGAA